MAYDEALAERIRDLLADEPGATERKMFGGLGFMIDGHMAVAAGSHGSLMLRVDPAVEHDLPPEHVAPMEMQGRPLKGWLLVDAEHLADDTALADLVARGVAYVRTLPPK